MKPKTVVLIGAVLIAFLVVALVAFWGRPRPRVELTAAELEISNGATAAPPASVAADAGMIRLVARPESKIRIEGTANMIHTRWQVEGTLIGGQLEVGAESASSGVTAIA